MQILREEPGKLTVATADGQGVTIGPPPPRLELATRGNATRWEIRLVGEGEEPRLLASGSGWRGPEADTFAALCAALLALGQGGELARAHGAPPFAPLPGAEGLPAPQLLVPEYELPPAVQRAVAFGQRSVPGGGRFLPDNQAAAGDAGRWVAQATWPAVIAVGALPALFMLGSWLPRATAGGEAFIATAEGQAGALLLAMAGLMVLVGLAGWVRQIQRTSNAGTTARSAHGVYLLDDALVIKQPVGCTYIPRGRLCGVGVRQPYPPFGERSLTLAYLGVDGQVRLHAYEGAARAGSELVLAIEAYIQAWRRATGTAP